MKRKTLLLCSLLCILAHPTQLRAWGQEGHRIIAQIAYDHLSPLARHRVDNVLGKHGMIYLANWPDEIKSDTIYPESSDWHFQDMDPGLSDSAVVAMLTDYPKKGGRMLQITDSLTAVLQRDRKQRDALVFVVHLMGDRFCPMHTGHLDDLGGNRVKCTWFKEPTNLHTIWDSKLIDARGYGYLEYAQYLEDKFAKDRRKIERMSDEELLLGNYHLTDEIYSCQTTWNGNAYHYTYHFAPAMERQLYTAGIRLAMVLNRLY